MRYLGHVIGRISSSSFGVDAAHLTFVVIEKLDGRRLEIIETGCFREGRHVVMHVLLCIAIMKSKQTNPVSITSKY